MVRIPPHIKHHFLRWHRRFGIFAAVFILLLAVTGILLNHSNFLSLDHKPISKQLQKWLYGIDFSVHAIHEFDHDTDFVQLNDRTIYQNNAKVAVCQGDFLGAHLIHFADDKRDQGYLVWCSNELLLVSNTGVVQERVGEFQGLPTPLSSIGFCNNESVCFESMSKHIYQFSTDELMWSLVDNNNYRLVVINKGSLSNSKVELIQQIELQHTGNAINLERMILDLHSGRLFGAGGVWLVDIIGILIILLALSGLFLWFGRRR
ncbi:MAG: PepSY domain-containing protein [Cellvibrionaceae bacterium]